MQGRARLPSFEALPPFCPKSQRVCEAVRSLGRGDFEFDEDIASSVLQQGGSRPRTWKLGRVAAY
eukprot:6024953-Pyramimonas_sp.AAC.1